VVSSGSRILRDAETEFRLERTIDDITPWSPEHPVVYTSKVELVEDLI